MKKKTAGTSALDEIMMLLNMGILPQEIVELTDESEEVRVAVVAQQMISEITAGIYRVIFSEPINVNSPDQEKNQRFIEAIQYITDPKNNQEVFALWIAAIEPYISK